MTQAALRRPVTVVVCTKDRPQMLPACVASIDADLGTGDELILLEDGDSGAAEALAPLPSRRL